MTKSRFLATLQCALRLWREHHEPDALEIAFDLGAELRAVEGRHVGELARRRFPGGVSIETRGALEDRVRATREAIASGAPAVFEAAFAHDGAFAAIDVLERTGGGFRIVEVKASTKVEDVHVSDAAFQTLVAAGAGLDVAGVDVLRLDGDCRHPDLSHLFVREDVTARVENLRADVEARLRWAAGLLAGDRPAVLPGSHCNRPHPCPFRSDCRDALPDDHVSLLYRADPARMELLRIGGIERMDEIPEGVSLGAVQARQVRAAGEGRLVVDRGLGDALSALVPPVAYLDFETIAPAVPVWPGMAPYEAAVVQISAHRDDRDGTPVRHDEWLADGPGDPRREAATRTIAFTEGAASVAVYNAGFERSRIREMETSFPDLAPALARVRGRLVDLLPIVRNHVYDLGFRGSFSIKSVLPALVPEASYDDLRIAGGEAASLELRRLLLERDRIAPEERDAMRRDLLAYCRMDTWAMVLLHRRLENLAGVPRASRGNGS